MSTGQTAPPPPRWLPAATVQHIRPLTSRESVRAGSSAAQVKAVGLPRGVRARGGSTRCARLGKTACLGGNRAGEGRRHAVPLRFRLPRSVTSPCSVTPVSQSPCFHSSDLCHLAEPATNRHDSLPFNEGMAAGRQWIGRSDRYLGCWPTAVRTRHLQELALWNLRPVVTLRHSATAVLQ